MSSVHSRGRSRSATPLKSALTCSPSRSGASRKSFKKVSFAKTVKQVSLVGSPTKSRRKLTKSDRQKNLKLATTPTVAAKAKSSNSSRSSSTASAHSRRQTKASVAKRTATPAKFTSKPVVSKSKAAKTAGKAVTSKSGKVRK
ncbi:hypothetical protein PRIPAC_71516 [Pristionchus pacificus]|uniref:Uncharacterized protein n=1 Tax=Pristionchus pacificus TaxID=54126 RepID=A0A2A6C5L5_PRIPA|nr:hypothetical protein PRIPAC_71516 [Pristionchus pacificus]|eukprot:PDM73406.1 hypothetical protein PRIPAC_40762 [Pristionchus pacificus]